MDWKAWLKSPAVLGAALTAVFLLTSVWQLTVVAAAITGFLARTGRRGGVAGAQAAVGGWAIWILGWSIVGPVGPFLGVFAEILGLPGVAAPLVLVVVFLLALLLGLAAGFVGGYAAELRRSRSLQPGFGNG